MYKEIAIDPKCMAKKEYFTLLKEHFGFDKGRYIVAEIKPWVKEAVKTIKGTHSLRPKEKKAIKTFLNRATTRKKHKQEYFLLSDDRKSIKDSISWEEWWKKQSEYRPFSVSFSESDIDGCINHEMFTYDDCDEWEIPPSISVKGDSAVDIVAALKPLLYLSKEITIIDSYFTKSQFL